MVELGARQLGRQPHAKRRLRRRRRGGDRYAQRVDFLFDGRQVGIHRLFQKPCLRRVQLLAALAVAPALVQRQFLHELVDVRLFEVQYSIPLGDHRVVRRYLGVTRGHLAHQAFGQRAQLLRVEVIQGCGTHGRQ